jgi:hypothetical protein
MQVLFAYPLFQMIYDLYFHQIPWKDISDWKDVQSAKWDKKVIITEKKPLCLKVKIKSLTCKRKK